jgi:hypothetical protein
MLCKPRWRGSSFLIWQPVWLLVIVPAMRLSLVSLIVLQPTMNNKTRLPDRQPKNLFINFLKKTL